MKKKETNYRESAYPKEQTKYYYIDGGVFSAGWDNQTIDKDRFNSGNYFATWEEGKVQYDWQVLNVKILNSIADINKEEGWVADWSDYHQRKWYICLDTGRCPSADFSIIHQYYETNRYLSDDGIDELWELYTQEQFKFWLTKEKSK